MSLAAGLSLACSLGASGADGGGYFADFELGAGAEWSITTRTNSPSFTTFLGRFGNNRVDLTLDTLAGAEYRLTYDFFAIDSWDGPSSSWGGEYFNVLVNEETLFRSTFSNFGAQDWSQTVAGAPTEGGPGVNLGFQNNWADSIYRGLGVDFLATGSITTISFLGQGLQGMNDESWGIDNVGVSLVRAPLPTVASLSIPAPGGAALAACVAFGAVGRRARPRRPIAMERLR